MKSSLKSEAIRKARNSRDVLILSVQYREQYPTVRSSLENSRALPHSIRWSAKLMECPAILVQALFAPACTAARLFLLFPCTLFWNSSRLFFFRFPVSWFRTACSFTLFSCCFLVTRKTQTIPHDREPSVYKLYQLSTILAPVRRPSILFAPVLRMAQRTKVSPRTKCNHCHAIISRTATDLVTKLVTDETLLSFFRR